MNIIQSLPAVPENTQLSLLDWLSEIQYQCSTCERLFADQYHDEAGGDGERDGNCPACIELALDLPSPSINLAQLNAEDFQFFIFQDWKPWSLQLAYRDPQKVEFCDLSALLKRPITPEKLFQLVCRKTEEIYLECFYQSLNPNSFVTISNSNDSPEHCAIVAFKRLVTETQPGTIDLSYIKKLGLEFQWLWIGIFTKEALPEKTLLRYFFHHHCQANGADYPSAIELYRRLEPLEILMKCCLREDKWLDERDKNLRFLTKNSPAELAAAAIASEVD